MNDEQYIRKAIKDFIRAYKAGDLAGLLQHYSEDLIKTRQGGEPENKRQTADRIAEVFQKNRTDIEVTIDELIVSGAFALARGAFEVTLAPKSGEKSITIRRRYLEIWRKEAEVWRVFRTMDNS